MALFVEYAEHGDREAVLAQDGEQGVELLAAGVGLALVLHGVLALGVEADEVELVEQVGAQAVPGKARAAHHLAGVAPFGVDEHQ